MDPVAAETSTQWESLVFSGCRTDACILAQLASGVIGASDANGLHAVLLFNVNSFANTNYLFFPCLSMRFLVFLHNPIIKPK